MSGNSILGSNVEPIEGKEGQSNLILFWEWLETVCGAQDVDDS